MSSNAIIAPREFRGLWRDDADARGAYSEAAGIHRIVPRAVAVPVDGDDTASLVRWAAANRIPLTARGAGSSMAGGAVGSGVIVDLTRLNVIAPVDAIARRVTVGTGAICGDVDAAAARWGLRFPVDPSSARFCTVGGMAGTNAAGGRTLRYGQMNAWVHGVECVFADGTRAWVRRGESPPQLAAIERFHAIAPALADDERRHPTRHPGVRKESSGYGCAAWAASGSLVDLLVGSEGTLALFTALELKLSPIPATHCTIVAAFASIEAAAASAAIAAELNATACELLDRTFLEIARRGGPLPVPDDADAVLLVDLEDASRERLDNLARSLAVAFTDAGASHVETALDAARATKLWHLRHAASPILAAMSRALISMQIVEDGAVPPARLADYVHGLRDILARHGFGGVLFGHAGDGHVHANVLVDSSEHDWRGRIEHVHHDAVALTHALGGTLTGEHGDGRLRAGSLRRMWPEDVVRRFRAVKDAFDPDGLLNPGVKFPAADAPVLGGPVKYDADVPPVSAAARRVLDQVQRERAWNRSRIELLGEESAR